MVLLRRTFETWWKESFHSQIQRRRWFMGVWRVERLLKRGREKVERMEMLVSLGRMVSW